MDKAKIQQYLLGNIDDTGLPGPSTETITATSTTRVYLRHDCSDEIKWSSTEYSLTVDLLDNSLSAQNYEAMPRSIIGGNNMVSATDETAIVKLSGSDDGFGTGFIVGNHVIATAAHCVYTGTEFRDLTIKIIDENNNVVETIQPQYYHVPKDAIYNFNGVRTAYDYALIYVEEDLSEYGMFKMGVATNDYVLQNGGIVVSGFPGQYPPNYSGPNGDIRFKASGNLYLSTASNINDLKLFYDADTFSGNSGGPVYVEEAFNVGGTWLTYKTVVAIHTSGVDTRPYDFGYDPNYNGGTRITPDVLKFYYNNTYLTE